MIELALALLLGVQGIVVPAFQAGTISGVLRDETGKPAAGVRIAAIPAGDPSAITAGSSAMSALAETDAEGRYTLDNVPPGRYYIAAGRLDVPTYYPGTTDLLRGGVITVAEQANLSGIDFRLNNSSRADQASIASMRKFISLLPAAQRALQVPVEIRTEDGSEVPAFSRNGHLQVRFSNVMPGFSSPLSSAFASWVAFYGPASNYRVSVENLPDNYVVKSVRYGAVDLTQETLRLSPSNFGLGSALVRTTTPEGLPRVVLAPAVPPPLPPTVVVVLERKSTTAKRGVRVSGKVKASSRSIYLSGEPGTLYTDGSFEFEGVAPGRHWVATLADVDSSTVLATSIVVGDRDIEGLELEETSVLPIEAQGRTPPQPAGKHAPGSSIPLSDLRGTVIDAETGAPIPAGTVLISGSGYGTSRSIQDNGTFEVWQLLPGSYILEIQAFGHLIEKRSVTIRDDVLDLQLKVQPLR